MRCILFKRTISVVTADCFVLTACEACLHSYKYYCTCVDNSIRWNMCKHIHYTTTFNLPIPEAQ
nr:unnamed protein product [Callosobruchus analis]